MLLHFPTKPAYYYPDAVGDDHVFFLLQEIILDYNVVGQTYSVT